MDRATTAGRIQGWVLRGGSLVRGLLASADGTLLDDATWARRHRVIGGLCWALAGFAVAFTIVDREDGLEWAYPAAMVVLMALASSGRLGRRPREVAVALTFVAAQLFISRYVGNLTGLGAVYIIVLSFYQDWVPIAAACLAALILVALAAIDPSLFADDAGFAKEAPLTGMSFRALSIISAAALALAVWRHGTQIARDQLTGLLSRAGAERILDGELSAGRRPAAWVCDVDNFRSVNADLGSAAGDALLRRVGKRLRLVGAALPGHGICARLDADAFLIATHDDPGEGVLKSFARRIEAEAGAPVLGIAGHEMPVRLSVGATAAVDGDDAATLIRAGEQAMRKAKGQGRVRMVVAHREPRAAEQNGSLLISELYRACERAEFELHLQPIVSLADGVPVGAESLVRWNHPDRGQLAPGAFLPAAERDSALMATLSQAFGAEFARTVASLVGRHGIDWLPFGFSHNLSAIRLRDPSLTDAMAELLAGTGRVDVGDRITLEVTEGALMDIEHEVPAVLAGLRDQGYRIALDDFGTGHSSLAHLRDFPLDTVKVDMSFVHSIERSETDRAVIRAVADIVAASGLTAVAEGVETESQRRALLEIEPGILAQGWLFARAMPPGEFEAWVLDRQSAVLA